MESPPLGAGLSRGDRTHARFSQLVRRWLAPVIAFAASSLAVVCVISVPDVAREVDELSALDARFAGWVGVSGLTATGIAAVGLLTGDRIGPAPAVALGAVAAVFGLALGRDVALPSQLVFALLILGVAVGALVAAGILVALELPDGWRRTTLAGWGLPLVSGWAVTTSVSMHVAAGALPRLTPHPAVWIVAAVAALLVVWAVANMLDEPPRKWDRSDAGWTKSWLGLLALLGMAGLAVMVVGYEPGIAPIWLRPVVVVATGVVVAGLLMVSALIPERDSRLGYLAAVVVALCAPTCVQLLMGVADAGSSRVTGFAVAALVASGWLGALLGWWRPERALVSGLLVIAVSAAGGWVMPASPWWMVLACGPMLIGFGMALFAALRLANTCSAGLRFTALGFLGALVVGLVAQIPLAWALTGDTPTGASAQSAGRVFLGLTFALAVPVAAYTSLLIGRTNGNGTTRRML